MPSLCWLPAVFDWISLEECGTQLWVPPVLRCAECSQKPGHQHVATISLKHLHAIAEIKQRDTPHIPLPSIVKALMGTCKSMGVRVVQRPEDGSS